MNKNKLTAWIAIAFAASAAFIATDSYAVAAWIAFILGAMLTPLRSMELLGENVIDSELNLVAFLDGAINAFGPAVMPLSIFASVFRNVQLRGTKKVEIIYYPIDTTTAKDFSYTTGYIFDEDTNTAHREIEITERKYVPLAFTGEELARTPMLNAEKLGALAGENLAYQVIQNVLSIVTTANFPNDGYVGATFDSDNVIDIGVVADSLTTDGRPTPWPQMGRGMVVNPDYNGKLLKDNSFKAAYAIGTDQVIRQGTLPNILGFDYTKSAAVPDNGENLVGFAAYMSAILCAFSPIPPPASVRQQMVDYRIVTHEPTGISFEYRQWGSPDFDTDKRIIECNFGFAKGEEKALLPIRSAAAES